MSKNKSYLDDLSEGKIESFQEEVFVKTPINYSQFIMVGIILAIVIGAIFAISWMNKVTVPEMSEWTMKETNQWIKKNKLSPIIKGVFSLDKKVNEIISIDVASGERISKSHEFNIVYSKGPDPEEQIKLIEFKGKTVGEVEAFIEENKMTGITIKKEINESFEKDQVINYVIKDGTKDRFYRKSRMTVYVSKGSIELDDTLVMPDFLGKSKTDVLTWMRKEKVTVEFEESFNESVAYGLISNQSVLENSKLTRGDKIVIGVSRGKKIQVPDFVGLTRQQATELATFHKIKAFFRTKVSGSTPDIILSQDIKAGEEIDSATLVTIMVAVKSNKRQVPDFVGLTLSEATQLAGLYDIKIFTKEVDSTEPASTIVMQDKSAGGWIGTETIVILGASKGLVVVPNFTQLLKPEANMLAQTLGVTLLIKEKETTEFRNGAILSQSIQPETKVKSGTSIICEVVVNSGVIIKDLRGMSRSEAELWASTNGVKLNVVERYNDDHPQGKLYDQNIINKWSGSKDYVTVYYSLGRIGVLDFVDRTKAEALKWMNDINQKGGNIAIKFALNTSTNKKRGTITKQDITADYLKVGGTIIMTVSATNLGIKIPDVKGMSEAAFISWANKNEVAYTIIEHYNDTYAVGKIFEQNHINRSLPSGEILKVKKSLGKMQLPDFVGVDRSAIEDWRDHVIRQGGKVNLSIVEENSDTVAAGKIIEQSLTGEIPMNTTINVKVSKGPA